MPAVTMVDQTAETVIWWTRPVSHNVTLQMQQLTPIKLPRTKCTIHRKFKLLLLKAFIPLQILKLYFRYTNPDAFMTQQYPAYQYGYQPPPQSTSPSQVDPNASPNSSSIQYPVQGESPSNIQFNQGQAPQPANGHYIITNGYGFNPVENGTYVSQIKTEDGETPVEQGEVNPMVAQYTHTVLANSEMLLTPSYNQPYQYVIPEGPVQQVVTSQPTSVAEHLPPVQAGSPSQHIELSMSSPGQQHQTPAQYDSPEAVYNQSISSSDSFTVKVESSNATTLHPMG